MQSPDQGNAARLTVVATRSEMPLWKRTIDLAACLVALPFLGLMTLVMAAVTRLFSPGPIFFKQERVGLRGGRFMCYKFRTMVVGADVTRHKELTRDLINSKAPMVKLDARGDSRLIPGGWLIRAAGLDELPQMVNVLRGEMSLIGPRPCVPYEYENYQAWQRERFNAVPGLSGLWQVSGKNRTTFDEMINLDIRYSKEKSLWMDLRIILMTVPALLAQIYDTRVGREPQVTSPGTVPPFAMRRGGFGFDRSAASAQARHR